MRQGMIVVSGMAFLLTVTAPAWAVITVPTPLSAEMSESQFICTVVVESVEPDRPGMVLAVDEVLKGKPAFKKLAVNLTGDDDSVKKKETAKLLKRVAPKLPLLLFVNQNDKHFTAFAYSNGTWFQMAGERADDGDVLRLPFTHVEPFLRRTFKGTTAELKQVVADGLAGKKDPPEPNLKEKPGLGPEVEAPDQPKEGQTNRKSESGKRKESTVSSLDFRSPISDIPLARGPVFGVIPMFVVGPLALLAMLFPAVFGGLTLVLKRWTTALTVLSLNSTLFFLQNLFGAYLITSWWGTATALWLAMSLVTLAGALWAWRKHALSLSASSVLPPELTPVAYAPGSPSSEFTWSRPMARTVSFFPPPAPVRFEPPGRGEVIVLGVLSLACLGMVPFLPRSLNEYGPLEKTVVMCNIGIWAATLHACYLRWVVARRRDARPGLPGEGVLLGAMLFVCVAFAFTLAPPAQADDHVTNQKQAADGEFAVRLVKARELFQPTAPSWIASSPRVDGGRIYVGAVHGAAFRSGAVYCIDRATGATRWAFNDGGAMKDVFSSPCVADGKVYVGEGFHQHSGCKLFCLDADSGKKLWQVPTGSHTESSPCVADGKVYFGAGDDGLFCVDAGTGAVVWHEGKGLHVDASPLVADGRVYCGSGVGDAYQETCVFCLDALTGKEIWRKPTDLPVWGESSLMGGRLYVGAGNGNFMDSDEKPAGAVFCYDAANGERIWRYDVPDGVHVRAAVDGACVYFASRDQHCYCLDRADGRLLWKKDLGSPVLASPILVRCPECGCSVSLYVATGDGQLNCLDPATGAQEWVLDVAKEQKQPAELFSSPAVVVSHEADGDHRRIYFGCGFNLFQRGVLYGVEDVRERK